MALYELNTFEDMVAAVREECQIQSTDTTAINRIKRDMNIVYADLLGKKKWWWLVDRVDVQVPAYVSTGTIAVTASSNAITFSSAPANSQKGRRLIVDGETEIYTIESHTAGATAAKLTSNYTGTTASAASFKVFADKLPLPVNCKETVDVWHEYDTKPLTALGHKDYRRAVAESPKREGVPEFYYTGDFRDPSPTSSISSLPALSTRASSGVVKTLTFASTVPSTVEVGDRIRVSKAGKPGYNGDVIVSSVSGSAITYTGLSEENESATADASLTVEWLDPEPRADRHRELYLYPSLTDTAVTLHVDFVKEVAMLENDDDEPVVPYNDRSILLYGTLWKVWSRLRNPEEAARNYQLYQTKFMEMSGKLQDSFDRPQFVVSARYLRAKRFPRTRRGW